MGRKVDSAILESIRKQDAKREQACLSHYATKDSHANRLSDGKGRNDHRNDLISPFAHDADRILHSSAYTRYIGKTQVFYLVANDQVTCRAVHVQLVSKIGRYIGRFLSLNEDLIEAIALGHDIGHVPFGHLGERILSKVCEEYGIGRFRHSVGGVTLLNNVNRLNLTLQVSDGILCHDGDSLTPDRNKNWDKHKNEIEQKMTVKGFDATPMTLEGCVVRLADKIAYLGRDIEDALRLEVITTEDIQDKLPEECRQVITGERNAKEIDTKHINSNIVNELVIDVVENSLGQDTILLSTQGGAIMEGFRNFNAENIYQKVDRDDDKIEELYRLLFKLLLKDVIEEREESPIFRHFLDADLKRNNPAYFRSPRNAEKVRDFIAGMTDRYFLDTVTPMKCQYIIPSSDA